MPLGLAQNNDKNKYQQYDKLTKLHSFIGTLSLK